MFVDVAVNTVGRVGIGAPVAMVGMGDAVATSGVMVGNVLGAT